MPFKATVAKFVRRKLQPAKGCDESYIVEDEAAVLRADIEKRMRDENFRIETHFTWVNLNPDERDSFRALFGKRGRPYPDEGWWKEFDALWAKYWEKGSGSRYLRDKNGCNAVDDALEIRDNAVLEIRD